MARMLNIRGRDPATESYRVVVEVDGREVTGLVPERLAADFRMTPGRPSHRAAYVWIADHKAKIEHAVASLARCERRPKAPFDQITLIEER